MEFIAVIAVTLLILAPILVLFGNCMESGEFLLLGLMSIVIGEIMSAVYLYQYLTSVGF